MDRIEKLERDLRNTRRACAMLAVFVLAGGFAAGWAAKHTNVSDELVAKKLRIVDADGNDAIALYVEDGASKLEVGVSGSGQIGVFAKGESAGLVGMCNDTDTTPTAALLLTLDSKSPAAMFTIADPPSGHAVVLTQPVGAKGSVHAQ